MKKWGKIRIRIELKKRKIDEITNVYKELVRSNSQSRISRYRVIENEYNEKFIVDDFSSLLFENKYSSQSIIKYVERGVFHSLPNLTVNYADLNF